MLRIAASLLLAATACTAITGTAAAVPPTSTAAALPPAAAGLSTRPADHPPVLLCGNGANVITVLNFFFDNRCRNGDTHPGS